MSRLLILAIGSAVVLCVACASPGEVDNTRELTGLGSPAVRNNAIYTPVSRSSDGCVLYSVRIPGGQAPAALMYRSVEGQFSYDRPERCVGNPTAKLKKSLPSR